MKIPIFIDGRRIYLRPLEQKDLEINYRLFNNPQLRRFLLLPFPITKSGEKEFIGKMSTLKDGVVLSVILKKRNRLIGNISLFSINHISRSASMGIAIADLSMASKGYGTEAMRLMVDYGFKTLNLHRIGITVHEFNIRAIKAYKKLGFVEEGRMRDVYFWDGRYYNDIQLSLLENEWY
jgi:RimJ/RimL family protein N-acetyltransferase